MFLTVFLSYGCSHCAHEVLHGRIDNKLLANAMSGQFPRELVLPFRFRVIVSCVDDILIVHLNLTVVALNDIRNACYDYSGCREALCILTVNSIDSNEWSFEAGNGSEERHCGWKSL